MRPSGFSPSLSTRYVTRCGSCRCARHRRHAHRLTGPLRVRFVLEMAALIKRKERGAGERRNSYQMPNTYRLGGLPSAVYPTRCSQESRRPKRNAHPRSLFSESKRCIITQSPGLRAQGHQNARRRDVPPASRCPAKSQLGNAAKATTMHTCNYCI